MTGSTQKESETFSHKSVLTHSAKLSDSLIIR